MGAKREKRLGSLGHVYGGKVSGSVYVNWGLIWWRAGIRRNEYEDER